MRWPRNCAAPDAPWRITTMSIRIASRFRAVSTSVSPLETREPDDGDVHRVRGQPLLGELERDAGAGGRLEEQIDDGLAAERRHLLDRPLADFLERLGGVENEPDLLGAQRLEPEQVLAEARRRLTSAPHQLDRVAAVELRDQHVHPVARARARPWCPTMSAWIGSSRPPRSISTQSRMRRGRPKSAQLVERGADRAAGVEHVVHDHDGAAVEVRAAGSRRRPGAGPTVWRSSR